MKFELIFLLGTLTTAGGLFHDLEEKPSMRATMFKLEAEAKGLKKLILEKKPLPVFQDSIPDMRHTQATDPDEITEDFKAFAEANLNLRQEIYKAKNPKPVFNRYIASCVKCHESHCPGPINRINKLRIE